MSLHHSTLLSLNCSNEMDAEMREKKPTIHNTAAIDLCSENPWKGLERPPRFLEALPGSVRSQPKPCLRPMP